MTNSRGRGSDAQAVSVRTAVMSAITRALPGAPVMLVLLCGCSEEQPPPARLVRTMTVAIGPLSENRSLTGEIRARREADIGFRASGKIVERSVGLGEVVRKGAILARLDAAQARASVTSAEAALAAAGASLAQMEQELTRQRQLVAAGFTTRARFDQAEAAWRTARANRTAAKATLDSAKDQYANTQLRADSDGVITAVGAEVGQVVQPGQMVVRIAQPSELEAVFHVPEIGISGADERSRVEVTLSSDAKVRSSGLVREIAPAADARTRTYEVKVSLESPPAEMRLGSTVYGRVRTVSERGVTLPPQSLFHLRDAPAVWVVETKTNTVRLRPIVVARFETGRVVVASGLTNGDIVVTAGVNTLHQGQTVRLSNGREP